MTTLKLYIRFILVSNRKNRRGLCPINCRITFNKARKDFSTGSFIDPNHWNSKKQKLLETSDQYETINLQLSLIKNKISKAFLVLQVKEIDFDVNDIYNHYKGKPIKREMGIMEIFDLHNERMLKLVGKEIVMATYTRYLLVKRHLKSFVYWKFKASNRPLKSLNLNFVAELEYYLKTEKNMQQITLNKIIQRFRKVIKLAIGNDYLSKDPFILYKVKTVKKEIVFLSSNELNRLEKKTFDIERLQIIKDCFIFCCYSGLAFKEMSNLRKDNIEKGNDGFSWIKITRQKTNKTVSIPILPKAQEIIDTYTTKDNDRILPEISNQRFNAYLKEIAAVVGITKNLTHHVARKTFASTVLLLNDVPMEIVSELLGHSTMVITQQSYGKIVQKKVSDEMKRLNEKLGS